MARSAGASTGRRRGRRGNRSSFSCLRFVPPPSLLFVQKSQALVEEKRQADNFTKGIRAYLTLVELPSEQMRSTTKAIFAVSAVSSASAYHAGGTRVRHANADNAVEARHEQFGAITARKNIDQPFEVEGPLEDEAQAWKSEQKSNLSTRSQQQLPHGYGAARARPMRPPDLEYRYSGGTRTNSELTPPTSESLARGEDNQGWKERLAMISNIASLLCVIDCTLLPLVSVTLPLLSWSANTLSGSTGVLARLSTFMPLLDEASHGMALFFVIPCGILTASVNYFFGHRELRISALSAIGIMMIYSANSSSVGLPHVDSLLSAWGVSVQSNHPHGHVHDACGAVVGVVTGMKAHTCPSGLAHRLVNTLGCSFLLGSNHIGKKYSSEENKGCAAAAFAEAFGGVSGSTTCPPGCTCQTPRSYGLSSVEAVKDPGDIFFQWEAERPAGQDRRHPR